MAELDFPDKLLNWQKAFFDAEERMTAAARSGDEEAFRQAREEAAEAAAELGNSEWLWEQPNRFEARMALRKAARPEG